MAEISIAGAAIGGAATLVGAAYSHSSTFSARHDHCHDSQALETQRLSRDFESAYRAGEIGEEEYGVFVEMKKVAIESAREYRKSIRGCKDTGILEVMTKRSRKKEVRRKKEQVRAANQNLLDHYYDSTSSESDASSLTATHGSPPGSGLEDENIREWADAIGTSASPVTFSRAWQMRIRQAIHDLEELHATLDSVKLVNFTNSLSGVPVIQCEAQALKFARSAEEYDAEGDIALASAAYSKCLGWLERCSEAASAGREPEAQAREYVERIGEVAGIYRERIAALAVGGGGGGDGDLIVLE